MENILTYRKELSSNLKAVFIDVEKTAAFFYDYLNCLKNCQNIGTLEEIIVKFKGELNQLAFALQYEDIIYQSFISLDAIFYEVEKINDGKVIITKEEAVKFSKLSKAVAGNTASLIVGSLENVDNRISRLTEIVQTTIQDKNLNHASSQKCIFTAENIREKIDQLLSGFKTDKNVPDFFVPSFSSSSLTGLTEETETPLENKESIAQRLADNFRIIEHKQILHSFFPGENISGESGMLELF